MGSPFRSRAALTILLSAVALAAITCGAQQNEEETPTPPAGQELGVPFQIAVGETVALASTGGSLTLDAVTDDSRCPMDVTCVWAGQATGSFSGTGEGGGPFPMELTLGSEDPPTVTFDSLALTLLRVEPQPLSTAQIEQADYRLTVLVEEDRSGTRTSGIHGFVTKGPMCPVAREDQSCPDEALQATLVVLGASGSEIDRVRSGPDGSYSVPLAPGTYILSPQSLAGSPFPRAEDRTVTVSEGRWQVADVRYDTGIR